MIQAPRPPGRIITFYSYKGGTGRSMALANLAWILACDGRRVLVIDWDLEAPGLHRYFRPFLIDEELTSSDGLIDMVDSYANQAISPVEKGINTDPNWYLEYADFSAYILTVNFEHFPVGGKIDFLPAGRQNDTYAITVSSFNWQNFYDRLGGGGFFEAVKDKARREYDYILIDSRTGVSDTAGICTVQMPDNLVVCFTYNNQSIKGAAAVARSSLKARAKLVEERFAKERALAPERKLTKVEDSPRPYLVYPVPMRVDSGESDRLAIRQAFARESFSDLLTHVGPSEIREYWSQVEVPHKAFYSYEEVLAPFKDDAHDPKTLLAALVRLTRYLTGRDVAGYRFPIEPEVKQRFLEAFAETPLTTRVMKTLAESRKETEEEVLVRNAETVIASLDDQEKLLARRVFGRLVRLVRDEEGGGFYPIRANVNDFEDAGKAIIAKLASYGVITVTSDNKTSSQSLTATPEQTVGLVDERLLKLWKTWQTWLAEDRQFLIWRQQLRSSLVDWTRSGHDQGALLKGILLSEAKLWRVNRAADLTIAEQNYIDTSVETNDRVDILSVTNDRLLKLWKALQAWLVGDRDFLIWRQQLRSSLVDWTRSGHDQGALLKGILLSEAKLWRVNRAADLTIAEQNYIDTSVEANDRVDISSATNAPPSTRTASVENDRKP